MPVNSSRFFVLFLVLASTLLLGACAGQKLSNPLSALNEQAPNSVSLHTFENDEFSVHYAKTGNSMGNMVVFLHGTSGNWQSYQSLLANTELLEKFTLIAVDRLGWGNSYSKNDHTGFAIQSRAIAAVIRQENMLSNKSQPAILVGHSLGASIAPKVAVDYPKLVAGLLLVAGALDPELSKPRWYNRLAQFKLVNVFVPGRVLRSNTEVLSLPKELGQFSEQFSELSVPVTIIQGAKDGLVNPGNIEFARKNLRHLGNDLELIKMPDAGHFVLWENPGVVSAALLRLSAKHKKQ